MRHAKKLNELPVENSVPRTGDELHYYMQNFCKYQILSEQKVAKLAARCRKGSLEARDSLVLHNMRLVAAIARQYWNSGLPLSDRIQLGVIGLMTSLKTFDPKLSKLVTYATPRIREEISRGIVKEGAARPFYIPSQMVSRVRLVLHATNTFWNEFERNPSNEEIYCWIKTLIGTEHETKVAEEISMADVVLCHDLINHGQWRSLDAPISQYNDSDATFADVFFDPNDARVENQEDLEEKQEQMKLLKTAVENGVITEQEQTILYLRTDNEKLSEIGEQFNLSRERIRQKELKAFKKIRRALGIKLKTKPSWSGQNNAKQSRLQSPQTPNAVLITKLFNGKKMTLPKFKGYSNLRKKAAKNK